MNKKWVLSLFLLFFAVTYYFLGSQVQSFLRPITGVFRDIYLSSKDVLDIGFSRHLSQAQTIAKLQKENKELTQQSLAFKARLKAEIDSAYMEKNRPTLPESVAVKETAVLSYSSLPNLYRMWIDYNPSSKAKDGERRKVGLIYPTLNKIDSVTCGIAIEDDDNDKFEAYLNGDPKCSYAVFIGKQKSVGILIGKNQNQLIVKYIPTWMEVKVGDEVITSGLDETFFEGVRVGVITKVFSDSAYKEALIEPYYNVLNPTKFYAVEIKK